MPRSPFLALSYLIPNNKLGKYTEITTFEYMEMNNFSSILCPLNTETSDDCY